MSKNNFLSIIFSLMILVSQGQTISGERHDLFELSTVRIFEFAAYIQNPELINGGFCFSNRTGSIGKSDEHFNYNLFSLVNTSELNSASTRIDYQRDRINELKQANEAANRKLKHQKTMIYVLFFLLILSACLLFLVRIQYKKFQLAYHRLFSKDIELGLSEGNSMDYPKGDELKGGGVFIKDEVEIYLQIKELFENQKIFLQKDISIARLADEIGTNTSYLSSVINNRFKMSFKTLLNKFRIDEARKLLVSEAYSCYSIEGIANEVGYHSRSTFYQVFRLQTGLTPTLYVKNYEKEKGNDIHVVSFQFEKLTLN